MKKIMYLAMLVVALFAFAACNNSSAPNSDNGSANKEGDSKKLTKITVSEPVRSEPWGTIYLAKSLGYFEEEGLDVEFVTVQGDMPTAPVLSGDAQFGLYGPEMILRFNEEGQGTKLLATATDIFPYSFVGAKDITSIEQVKGQIVNAADSGSTPRAFVRAVLANAGLNPDGDATYANIANPAIIPALEKGEIKGSYVSPAARAFALEAGFPLLIDTYKSEVHKQITGSESYETYIVFATDKYIKENPENVQKFINAVYKATRWADTHSAEEIIASLQPLFEGSKTLETGVKEIKKSGMYSSDGTFSEDGFKAINKIALDAKIIKAPVERSAAIDDSFIKKAIETIK